MLTFEEQIAASQKALNEVGSEPPCPFCHRARVLRSDYIRCNPCGMNWLVSEMHLPNYLNRNPAAARSNPDGARLPAHTGNSASHTANSQAEDAESI